VISPASELRSGRPEARPTRSANTGGRLESVGPSFAHLATGRTRQAACCAGSPVKLKLSGSKLHGPIVVTTMAGSGRLGRQTFANASSGIATTRTEIQAADSQTLVTGDPTEHQ
jgi:hypothetical protein